MAIDYWMISSPSGLRIVVPDSTSSDCPHTCSNNFRIVQRIGKGTHGHVFMALHIPTKKIYAIKRIRCGTGTAQTNMRCELQALIDLCNHGEVDEQGTEQARPTTLSPCQRCCRQGGYECIEGGVWISNSGVEQNVSPTDSTDLFHASLSDSLFSMLALRSRSSDFATEDRACPFLVSYYDSFPNASSEGQCLVIEYMRWSSLQERLTYGHVFSTDELALIAYSVVKALVFIATHDYVHRDVKPANILMDAKGHIKLADFGTACIGAHHCSTSHHGRTDKMDTLLAGTLFYMPPEGYNVHARCTHKSDIWSLGMTLVHLLLGTHPFVSLRSYWELRSRIASATVQNLLPADVAPPEPMVAFLERCIAQRPEDRATAVELLQSPFLQEAIAAGQICEEDPRLAAFAEELNGSIEMAELSELVTAVRDECAPEEDLTQTEQIAGLADQLGVPESTLVAAMESKSGEKS